MILFKHCHIMIAYLLLVLSIVLKIHYQFQ